MFKKILRRLAWTIGIVLILLLLAHAAAVLYTGWLLEVELAARREAGLPNSFQDLALPRIPADENAAAEIELAVPWAEGINQELYDILSSPEYDDGQLSEAATQQIDALADAYERMCAPLRRAADMERYQSLILTEFSGHFHRGSIQRVLDKATESRNISRALQLRAMQLAADDRQDEAVDMLCLILSTSRQLASEPTMTGYLVSLGCKLDATETLVDLIGNHPISEKQRKLLDEELARHDDFTYVKAALQSEAVYTVSMMANLSSRWIGRPVVQCWQYNHLKYINALSEAIALQGMNAKMPPASTEDGYVSRYLNLWVSLSSKAFDSMRRSALNDLARVRCLRTMLALQAYLATQADETPELATLGLTPEEVRDPYTQEPLRLERTDSGWLVYSVGSDDVDDGGDFEKDRDVGYLLPAAPDGSVTK